MPRPTVSLRQGDPGRTVNNWSAGIIKLRFRNLIFLRAVMKFPSSYWFFHKNNSTLLMYVWVINLYRFFFLVSSFAEENYAIQKLGKNNAFCGELGGFFRDCKSFFVFFAAPENSPFHREKKNISDNSLLAPGRVPLSVKRRWRLKIMTHRPIGNRPGCASGLVHVESHF